jgi:arylsulfatase A-like enzyme
MPMHSEPEFRATLKTLWFRLITLAIVLCLFYESLVLVRGKAEGWSFYLTRMEVGYEVLVRLVAVSLAGLLVGTVATACLAHILWYFKSRRERLADWAIKLAVIVAVFICARYTLIGLTEWATGSFSDQTPTSVKLTLVAFYLAFAVALCVPRSRKEVLTSLDGILSEKMTRRTALVTVAGAAGLVATEYALSKSTLSTVKAALPAQRPKSNFVLITFDALAAEDMSLYGRALPTTPNIDAFSRQATVFTKYFSACTFTTPCIATMMTGLYPSETGVYQIQGRLRRVKPQQNLPHLLRAGGYFTGAFVSNSYAYFLVKNFEDDFDALPQPHFQEGALPHFWHATELLHQDSRIGNRTEEYWDLERVWNRIGGMPPNLSNQLRPARSFAEARQMLQATPEGFFLWVHVMAPHNPYIPDAADRGRFLPDSELMAYEYGSRDLWPTHYPLEKQNQFDRLRLGYDEYIATADREFGAFQSDLENSGRLANTTVIVSADHGESFEGGYYSHGDSCQNRPVIHVPLIIRTPGQQDGRKVAYVADATTLAPTILELAGQPRPDWMRGQSLVKWLNGDGLEESQGLAFTQYLERNSVFKPLRHGTVGVIDGEYQYVVELGTQKGALRPLNEAQILDLDCSAENPERVKTLRAAIHSRFPDLIQQPT